MPVPFDFDRRPTDSRRRDTKSKYLRFILVLVAVAVITAVLIMMIVPNRPDNTNGGNSGKTAAAKEGTITDNGAVMPDSKNDPVFSDDPANKVAVSGKTYGKTASNNNATGKKESRKGSANARGRESAKGKITASDLPAELDRPQFRKNALPNIHADLNELANADPAAAIKAAQSLLMREAAAGGEFSENWYKVGALLTAKRKQLISSTSWRGGADNYKVVSGDALERVARKNSTTVELIKSVNNLKSNNIRIGQRLKVIKGPWRVNISRKARTLNIWQKSGDSWRIYAVFPVGIGRDNKTPTGKFAITNRLYHPVYRDKDGRVFKYASPENPFGDCFLKISSPTLKRGNYGIHGSPDDNSVGRSLSNGCVRMRNADVMILYYLLPARTPVEIVD